MKNILITGANKGIGFETAKQLAQLGYFVFLGCRNLKKGTDAVNLLKESGLTNVEALEIDVADINSVKKARATLEAKVESLDALINNAGIAGEQPQNISACSMDLLRKVFDTNYFGTIQTTQQFLNLLMRSEDPAIINVSSESGSVSMQTSSGRSPNWDFYNVYGSSKIAVNSFTIMLANELRDTKFRVNSVTPGYTATDLNDFKGLKSVQEGAKPIVRLVTSNSENITGKFFREEGTVPW
ncbi:SDR family NAD(P)-dependent oxidoreductase [Mucilaginibacter sp. X4EP1]|uniref:SDR family NAD(P)-dependent oxidoreductase n=1 Tax=Mucilaginibacter sp. X4EP1 TaxID=2723092 RepID=UPI002169F71F|nr:SDR family NAD(P)-dependent oxidoreductase [Mucilaginibacter sp. X4EP1]MCS3812044.1 NAD(P)-dependent dehydrogenase (short-subunit alcohol dehydrogenase family) [Mucilaginibacter sp. X4EP1]